MIDTLTQCSTFPNIMDDARSMQGKQTPFPQPGCQGCISIQLLTTRGHSHACAACMRTIWPRVGANHTAGLGTQFAHMAKHRLEWTSLDLPSMALNPELAEGKAHKCRREEVACQLALLCLRPCQRNPQTSASLQLDPARQHACLATMALWRHP